MDFDEFIHTTPDGRIMEIEIMITENISGVGSRNDICN